MKITEIEIHEIIELRQRSRLPIVLHHFPMGATGCVNQESGIGVPSYSSNATANRMFVRLPFASW